MAIAIAAIFLVMSSKENKWKFQRVTVITAYFPFSESSGMWPVLLWSTEIIGTGKWVQIS